MKLEIPYSTKTGSFTIKTVNNIDYIYCPCKNSNNTQDISFNLKNKLHPALKDFIELDITNTAEICDYCKEYGLLFSIENYIEDLSKNTGATQFAKPYLNELFPPELSFGIAMPLALFIYYKKTFDTIISFKEHLDSYKKNSLQVVNRELFEGITFNFLQLLFKPYFWDVPYPYNHYFQTHYELTRFFKHFSHYINKNCLNGEHLSINSFFKFSKKSFFINNEYQKLHTMLRRYNSEGKHIDIPRLESSILDYKNDFFFVDITYSYAQDLISDDYKILFKEIIPYLQKDFGLKINTDYSIQLKTDSPLPNSYITILDAISRLSNHLILHNLSALADDLSLELCIDETTHSTYAKLSINTLLQFLSINMTDFIERTEVRICDNPGCKTRLLEFSNQKTIRSKCCSKHYSARQKYLKRHNPTPPPLL